MTGGEELAELAVRCGLLERTVSRDWPKNNISFSKPTQRFCSDHKNLLKKCSIETNQKSFHGYSITAGSAITQTAQ